MEYNSQKEQKPVILRSMDIPLGTALTCLFKGNTKLEAQLVGYEHDNFMLIKFPAITGIANYLVKDENIAVLFKANGCNVTFSASLTTIVARKFLAFCNYPSQFKLYEIRNAARIDCLLPAAMTYKLERFFAVVQDMSMDGCKLSLDGVQGTMLRKLESEDEVVLEVWTQKDTIHINAKVMRVLKNLSRITLGLSFGDLDKQGAAIVQSFMLSMQFSGTTNKDEGG